MLARPLPPALADTAAEGGLAGGSQLKIVGGVDVAAGRSSHRDDCCHLDCRATF